MKKYYDRKRKFRKFEADDKILIFFPESFPPFSPRLSGPYEVIKTLSERNYLIANPDKNKKRQFLHIYMLRQYNQ